MKLPKDFRVCVSCSVPHVENCPKCFGWGFHLNGVPIRADEVENVNKNGLDFEMCFECFGEPTNEDIFTFWGDPRIEEPKGIIGEVMNDTNDGQST